VCDGMTVVWTSQSRSAVSVLLLSEWHYTLSVPLFLRLSIVAPHFVSDAHRPITPALSQRLKSDEDRSKGLSSSNDAEPEGRDRDRDRERSRDYGDR
jgi:hypothetical protein